MTKQTERTTVLTGDAELLGKATDLAALGMSIAIDLFTICTAIRKSSEPGSQVHRLASIGEQLADNGHNSLEYERNALRYEFMEERKQ